MRFWNLIKQFWSSSNCSNLFLKNFAIFNDQDIWLTIFPSSLSSPSLILFLLPIFLSFSFFLFQNGFPSNNFYTLSDALHLLVSFYFWFFFYIFIIFNCHLIELFIFLCNTNEKKIYKSSDTICNNTQSDYFYTMLSLSLCLLWTEFVQIQMISIYKTCRHLFYQFLYPSRHPSPSINTSIPGRKKRK